MRLRNSLVGALGFAVSAQVVLLTILALVCASLAIAQSDLGSISGFVKDPTGAVIPVARVMARNQTGLERTAMTNETGHYTITNIPPGLYTITVDVAGFKKYETSNNKLDPSSSLVIDATLTVGSATEVVEVSGTAQVLQTESASVQRNVTREQIDALELNGRNPIFMASLVPGARGGNLASLNFGMTGNLGPRPLEQRRTSGGKPEQRPGGQPLP